MQVGDYPEMVFSNFKAGSLHRLWSKTGPHEPKKITKFRGEKVEFEPLINHGRYFDELTQMWPTVAAICPHEDQPRQGDPQPHYQQNAFCHQDLRARRATGRSLL